MTTYHNRQWNVARIHATILSPLLILLLIPFLAICGDDPYLTISKLFSEQQNTTNDSLKIVKLSEIAGIYFNYIYDKKMADSTSDVAVKIAELSCKPGLLLLAYNRYLECNDVDLYFQKAVGYGNNALQLCRTVSNPEMEWRTCHNLALACLSHYEYDKAMEWSNKAFGIATAQDNSVFKAESYLDLGNSLECKNQKVEAFGNYLNAIDLAEKTNNIHLLEKCYGQLSGFYNLNKLFDKAIFYKLKQGDLIRKKLPVDSIALMWIQYDLQVIQSRSGISHLNAESVKNIIDFSIRRKAIKLKLWEFGIYRKYLIDHDRIDLLYDLYVKQYPEEIQRIKKEEYPLYLRLMAFFEEEEHRPDSAYFYFTEAEKVMILDPNKIMVSNFYNRFGQFLKRHGRNAEALVKFKKAYDFANSDTYFGKIEFMLNATKNLEAIYKDMGDYRNAYTYSTITRVLSDSVSNMTKKEQVIILDINRETMQKEHAAELEKQRNEKTIRQRKTERNMMAGGVGFLIILSLLIFRNYKTQKRSNTLLDIAKKKSEELLLNILPHETAEELMHSGSAKAKRFEEVTVMFTDFKDFTQHSEKMTAEELVKEIHFYFSEFDRIISSHNIEKIKIIGDSYMCAGGLPVPNTSNPFDVVSAALELQSFMVDEKRVRIGMNQPYFELRIGIHTGPVVAGIVGTKKFAYDIWGDTVNTASRMENSGETDKVNISGATYERIKDRFHCTYRGKVEAKHKGEIDMYFVEPLSRDFISG